MSRWDYDHIPGGSRSPVPPRWPGRRVQNSLLAWLILAPLIGLALLGGWIVRQFAPAPPSVPPWPVVVAVPPTATSTPPGPTPTFWWRLDYAVPTILPRERK